MRNFAAYGHFYSYLHKRICTKINYKGSVTQDMEAVNILKQYIVFKKIKNLQTLQNYQISSLFYYCIGH